LRYFFDTYNYSFQTLDSGALAAISTSSCKFCQGVVKDVTSARRQGLRFEGARISVKAAVAAPGDIRKGLLVNSSIDQSAGRTLDGAGVVQRQLPASRNVRVDAGLRWTGRAWRVFAVALPES
jgi:hypothetical protein